MTDDDTTQVDLDGDPRRYEGTPFDHDDVVVWGAVAAVDVEPARGRPSTPPGREAVFTVRVPVVSLDGAHLDADHVALRFTGDADETEDGEDA